MSDIVSAAPSTPETKAKKTRVGLVVSNKMNKTIVVEVERRRDGQHQLVVGARILG